MSALFRSMVLLFTLMGFATYSVSQTGNVTDSSPDGSPLSLSGTVTFNDNGSARTPYSLTISGSAKNLSERAVLLFKISFEILSDGASSGPHEYTDDLYFSPNVFGPKSNVKITFAFPRYGPRVPRDQISSLSANAKVEFVEFEDGTTWGDSNTVRDAFRTRKLTLYELNVLKNAFTEAGNEGFSKEIMRITSELAPLAELQNVYKKSGLEKAKATAWGMLAAANEHSRAVGPTSCTPILDDECWDRKLCEIISLS